MGSDVQRVPKPHWVRTKFHADTVKVDSVLARYGLATICREASCPNRGECFHHGTASFLILGRTCTRQCTFCDVASGTPDRVDEEEPQRLAEAVHNMGLSYAVVTSVNRDDLPDGGAAHFVRVIEAIRARCPQTKVEVLTPDFMGNEAAIALVVAAQPDVLNHNIETIAPLYYYVRPQADYQRSLNFFRLVKKMDSKILTKSGIMVGLGETPDQLKETLRDLLAAGVELMTIGQYLSPSKRHLPVEEYVHPDKFAEYRRYALDLGFRGVVAGTFIRSSYRADLMFAELQGSEFSTLGDCRK